MSKQYRNMLMDQAKMRIVHWAAKNPQWTPEDLIANCKFWIKHYGLKNRYLPPDFKKDKEEPSNDSQRVETADVGPAQSG